MSKRDTRTPKEQELDERIRRAKDEQERLDETLTRRDVLEAIEWVASEYGGNGTPESDLISEAFRKLAGALA